MSTSMRASPAGDNRAQSRISSVPADAAISQAGAIAYWSTAPATVDGMLGGFPQVSRTDLQSSSNFLAKLRRRMQQEQQQHHPKEKHGTGANKASPARWGRAVDCGAGIGRVTKGLLSNVAEVVDILEPVEKFTQEVSCGEDFAELRQQGRIGNVFQVGMEEWNPPEGLHYDLVWNQWCLGQLNDAQLEQYLVRCKGCITPTTNTPTTRGWIIVKENLSTDPEGKDIFDEVDSSVTRTDDKFQAIFRKAGLKIIATEMQRGFPAGLFPVRIYALRPDTSQI